MTQTLRSTAAAGFLAILGLAACSNDNVFDVSRVSAQGAGDIASAPLAVIASGDGSKASAGVVVAQGTQLIDANGAVINATDVTMTIEAADGSSAAEKAFEGGVTFVDPSVINDVAAALGESVDSSQAVTVDLAGYAVIKVFAGGVEVKEFNPPLTVTIATPDAAVGSTVAIITVDEDTGVRRFEGTAVVRSDRTVQFALDHLTVAAAISKTQNSTPATQQPSGGQGG